jgi:ribosomal protein S19E (S16A)
MLNPKALVPAIVTRGALSASASSKKKQNDVLTHLYWAGRRGADLEDDVSDLEEAGLVRTVKTGKKLTKEGVARFAKISKKKAELVEKGVRNH